MSLYWKVSFINFMFLIYKLREVTHIFFNKQGRYHSFVNLCTLLKQRLPWINLICDNTVKKRRQDLWFNVFLAPAKGQAMVSASIRMSISLMRHNRHIPHLQASR